MRQKIIESCKKNAFLYIWEAIAFAAILITGILFRQNPLYILPLFISLFIMFLQANVNRYAFLLGGLNSILYATVYFLMTLYSSAAYALLVSCPLQIATFLGWKRKADGNSVILRKMSWKERLLLGIILVVSWLLFYLIFSLFGSAYMILDNTVSILGIVATVLTMLRFMEYGYLTVISSLTSLVMHITIFLNFPAQITYVIFTVYSIVCTFIAIYNMHKRYRKQQNEQQAS